MRKTEQVLSAFLERLKLIDGPVVLRNEDKPQAVPDEGLVVLRDGAPGEPAAVYLSPPLYVYEHEATLELFARGVTAEERANALDALIETVGALIAADRTLGGACDDVRAQAPEPDDGEVEGAASTAFAAIPVILEYATSDPLA